MENKKEIFFCYAREDEKLRIELEKQLNILKRQGFIEFWSDREISAGTEWEREIDVHLNTAHIILLLVSPDFMVSDYCYSKEMRRAMQRHEVGEARVIPIILRPVYWRGAPFGKLQALPTDGKPVVGARWHNLDEAFYDVAEGIRKAVENLNTSPLVDSATSRPAQDIWEKELLEHFDVCLSYSAADAVWAENLAKRLRDEHGFRVRLDRWVLLSEQSSRQADAGGMDRFSCCIVCIGELTSIDWFRQEIQRALDRQSKESSFRVIPVLLPNAKAVNVRDFPELRVWVDFSSPDQAYALHLLVCGLKGVPPGRWSSGKTRESRG